MGMFSSKKKDFKWGYLHLFEGGDIFTYLKDCHLEEGINLSP